MRWAPILMYHQVLPSPPSNDRYAVSLERFEAQVRLLRRLGYRAVTMSQLLGLGLGERRLGRFVALTFDDGTRDLLTHVLPVLDRYEAAATVFAVAGANAGDGLPSEAHLSGEELRALPAWVEVGSHGLTHRRLPGLPQAELEAEVAGSRAELQETTGRPIDIFAYPYCALDAATVVAVVSAGYRAACGGPQASHRRYSLQRLEVNRDPLLLFLLKVTGLWSRLRTSGTVRALRRARGGLQPRGVKP